MAIVKPHHRSDRYGRYGLLPLYYLSVLPILRRVCGERSCGCVRVKSSFFLSFFLLLESDSERVQFRV